MQWIREETRCLDTTLLLQRLDDLPSDQNEIHFRWPLPAHLPSSFYFATSTERGGIEYTLEASLQEEDETVGTSQVSLDLRAIPECLVLSQTRLAVCEPTLSTSACCSTKNQGEIRLGMAVATSVVVLGSQPLKLQVSGANRSNARVRHVWVELKESSERVVASVKLPVGREPAWQPNAEETLLDWTETVELDIPVDELQASYEGSLCSVSHELVARALDVACSLPVRVTRTEVVPDETSETDEAGIQLPTARFLESYHDRHCVI